MRARPAKYVTAVYLSQREGMMNLQMFQCDWTLGTGQLCTSDGGYVAATQERTLSNRINSQDESRGCVRQTRLNGAAQVSGETTVVASTDAAQEQWHVQREASQDGRTWLFVFPQCGFSLSLFCNYYYKTAELAATSDARLRQAIR